MNSEVLSFDAMPHIVATILKKLETLEQKFDALQSNNNVEADAWFSLCKTYAITFLTILPNRQFTVGQVIAPFPIIRMVRVSFSVSRKLTTG